jgi:hypothetical protein
MAVRRGAGAVERGSLENCWPFTGPVSSNLTPAVHPRQPASSVAPGHLDDRSVQGEIRAAAPRRPGRPDGRRAHRRLVHFRCRSAAASPTSDHAAHADAPDGDRAAGHDSGRDDARDNDPDGASSATGSSGAAGPARDAADLAASSIPASERLRTCGGRPERRRGQSGGAGRDEPGTGLPAPSRS